MKPKPIRFTAWKARAIRADQASETRRRVKVGDVQQQADGSWWPIGKRGKPLACPYGEAGTVLWVQEPWRYLPSSGGPRYALISREHSAPKLRHRGGWEPSHMMPYLACDQWLLIQSIKVERIQDITEEGISAEGVPCREGFQAAWDLIHGPESWTQNEWVWVIRFTKTCAPSAENTEKEA